MCYSSLGIALKKLCVSQFQQWPFASNKLPGIRNFFRENGNSPKWGRANTPNVLRQTSQPRTRIGGIDLTEKETKHRENSIKDTFCYVFLITAQHTFKTPYVFPSLARQAGGQQTLHFG